jgi:hypothetical protein
VNIFLASILTPAGEKISWANRERHAMAAHMLEA